MAHDLEIIQVSFPTSYDTQPLIEQLIRSKLVICVHKFPPIMSYYSWKSTLECNDEQLVHMKSKSSNFQMIEQLIMDAHPYDTPEILSIPIHSVSAPYLDWATSI